MFPGVPRQGSPSACPGRQTDLRASHQPSYTHALVLAAGGWGRGVGAQGRSFSVAAVPVLGCRPTPRQRGQRWKGRWGFAFRGQENIALPHLPAGPACESSQTPSRQQIPEPPPSLLPAAELPFPMEAISSAPSSHAGLQKDPLKLKPKRGRSRATLGCPAVQTLRGGWGGDRLTPLPAAGERPGGGIGSRGLGPSPSSAGLDSSLPHPGRGLSPWSGLSPGLGRPSGCGSWGRPTALGHLEGVEEPGEGRVWRQGSSSRSNGLWAQAGPETQTS